MPSTFSSEKIKQNFLKMAKQPKSLYKWLHKNYPTEAKQLPDPTEIELTLPDAINTPYIQQVLQELKHQLKLNNSIFTYELTNSSLTLTLTDHTHEVVFDLYNKTITVADDQLLPELKKWLHRNLDAHIDPLNLMFENIMTHIIQQHFINDLDESYLVSLYHIDFTQTYPEDLTIDWCPRLINDERHECLLVGHEFKNCDIPLTNDLVIVLSAYENALQTFLQYYKIVHEYPIKQEPKIIMKQN